MKTEIAIIQEAKTRRHILEFRKLSGSKWPFVVYKKWQVIGDGDSIMPNKSYWYCALSTRLFRSENENEARKFFNREKGGLK